MEASVVLAKEQAKAKREALELAMLQQIKAVHLHEGMTREHQFCPGRKWRADFAWTGPRLLLEVEGGTWTGGRHVTGAGFSADAEKYATATAMGWRVLRVTGDHVRDGRAVQWLQQALAAV